MNTYYIVGYPITDELYHHGIKGQKWGVRRYQNEDGTLTAEGKKRYGKGLGEYANRKEGLIRKVATGNWLLGRKQLGERLEQHYKNKVKDLRQQGRTDKAENYGELYKAQRQRNIDREKYLSNVSTGKVIAQNFLLGRGADSYRVERQNNSTRGEAATASILGYAGDLVFGMGAIPSIAADIHKSEKRYGRPTL